MASVAYFLSLGTLAVSLFAWFSTSSTFSWFSQNKQVDASGMAVQIKAEENVDIQMDVYKYIEKTKPEDDSSGSTTEVGTGEYHVQKRSDTNNYPLSLARYDRVFKEDNIYSPILLKLTLTGGMYTNGETLPLKIHHDTSKDTTVIADSTGTTTGTVDGKTYRLSSYISSVVSIKAMVYNDPITYDDATEKDDYESEAGKIFQTMRAKFDATENVEYETQFFVKDRLADGTIASKNEYAAFTSLEYAETTNSSTNAKSCILYIWIDYDESTEKYGSDTTSQNGLINAYIEQMMNAGNTTGINVSYPLFSDIDELSIVRSSSSSN